MSCGADIIECDTVQIIEPRDDLLVDVAGSTNDMDERGSVELHEGQVNAIVLFEVQKLNANYSFEYLYIDAEGNSHRKVSRGVRSGVCWCSFGFPGWWSLRSLRSSLESGCSPDIHSCPD